jgi:hypothetical protein
VQGPGCHWEQVAHFQGQQLGLPGLQLDGALAPVTLWGGDPGWAVQMQGSTGVNPSSNSEGWFT